MTLTEKFATRLPHEALYRLDGPHPCYGMPLHPWFGFLAAIDSGRCPDRSKEFPYVIFHYEKFIRVMKPLLDGRESGKFFDVGCGGGDKLATVRALWPHIETFGVEHDPAMACWAGEFGDVICGDAFDVDYSGYDAIYAYWPIADKVVMDQLARHIVANMNQTAVFVAMGYAPTDIWNHPRVVCGENY